MKILPLFIPFQGCPFRCIYCNQISITNTTGTKYEDLKTFIKNFCYKNQEPDKEIAFFGGTFTALPQIEQLAYLQLAAPYFSSIRGIRLSTRPDCINIETLKFLKDNRVTTIELGIQSFSDKVLLASARGYKSEKAVAACKLISGSGFDLIIQLMPALPGDDYNTFMQTLQQALFLHPAGVRIYPTLVLRDTALEIMYKNGSYKPLELNECTLWLKQAIKMCQEAQIPVLKLGLHSDLALENIVAGPFHPALGELVRIELLYDYLVDNWDMKKTLQLSSRGISLFRGHGQLLIQKLKEHLLLDKIPVCIIKEKKVPLVCFVETEADIVW
jgi:histone acetyltransferase (RNA polymerase elongator complex component)